MGLLGSERFVRKPAVPLDKIVAAINLDMVGRNKEGEISVVGRTETPDLVAPLFDRFAPEVGFALNDDAGAGAGRSDNGSLWLGGIPTASLFSGTHEDYHQPEDTWDKVLPEKIARAARLSFLVAYEVASGEHAQAPGRPRRPLEAAGPGREGAEVRTAAVLLSPAVAASACAAEDPDPRALLEKAIAFHGGKEALASLPDVKATGTIETPGRTAGRARDVVVYERGDGGRRPETVFALRGARSRPSRSTTARCASSASDPAGTSSPSTRTASGRRTASTCCSRALTARPRWPGTGPRPGPRL